MKKKIHMICYLKNGQVVKDVLKIKREDITWVNALKEQIEVSSGKKPGDTGIMTSFTFGYTVVVFDEVAAVKIW